jgi:hypothetical protein
MDGTMRRMRIHRKGRIPREERNPILPLDPRDADVGRAKRIGRAGLPASS